MANIFNSVSVKTPKRNKFKLNHQVKLTGEMGELLPIMCEPVLPGDRFKLSAQSLVRFAPLTAPIMTDIDVYHHFYFVPNRIIWKEWETFITGCRNGKKLPDEEVPVPPRLVIDGQSLNTDPTPPLNIDGKPLLVDTTLADYLGFPTVHRNEVPSRDSNGIELDELPFRAYQRIFFDWYRDENLSSFDDFNEIDNDDYNNGDNDFLDNQKRSYMLMALQRRAWKKDYFTSALPWAQKGDDITIPFESSGTLKTSSIPGQQNLNFYVAGNNPSQNKGVTFTTQEYDNTNSYGNLFIDNSTKVGITPNLFQVNTDGKIANEATIRELRRAFAAQRFLEREAVGGTRYIEQILSFFGVKSSDARLQRSEFLGGMKQPVVVSQVLQTSQSTTTSPLGQPAGNAVSVGGKYIFDREFEEHGFIIGLISIVPKAEYMNGYPRKYLKRDRFEYYWPQFAKIGEQPIERQEINYTFSAGNHEKNQETFGYTPRYAEYRFINSHIHGDFKDENKLGFWTLARDFGNLVPQLNESFIQCRPSTRIYAYENSDFNHVWIQSALNISALRPLPKYGEAL